MLQLWALHSENLWSCQGPHRAAFGQGTWPLGEASLLLTKATQGTDALPIGRDYIQVMPPAPGNGRGPGPRAAFIP